MEETLCAAVPRILGDAEAYRTWNDMKWSTISREQELPISRQRD